MTFTWKGLRSGIDRVAQANGEWAGIPVPVECARLVVAKGHPYYDRLNGVQLDAELRKPDDNDGAVMVNSWRDDKNQCDVVIWREADGKLCHARLPAGPIQRIKPMFDCMYIASSIDIEAERRAMKTLQGLIAPHLYESYEITGRFLETSKRSGVVYIFRRLATTLAIRPGWAGTDDAHFLAALCLHPIAYYEALPMGAMVPTDDVIAHLVMMRADEKMFWRKSNQHDAHSPGAQL